VTPIEASPAADYVRYESTVPHPGGRHPGIFAMLRGLRETGRLSDADGALAAELVARSYALHDEPDATVFETVPRAISWFVGGSERSTALCALAEDVAALLARYGIATREVRTSDPGRITFADDVQVVAVPPTDADWPF
jgi:hypothetical protein